jgi:hypothetical protein
VNQAVLMVLTVSILGLLGFMMNFDAKLVTTAYAAPLPTDKFCFGTGPFDPSDPFGNVSCYKGLGTCKKAEVDFISNGGTVFGSCTNVFKHVKP